MQRRSPRIAGVTVVPLACEVVMVLAAVAGAKTHLARLQGLSVAVSLPQILLLAAALVGSSRRASSGGSPASSERCVQKT